MRRDILISPISNCCNRNSFCTVSKVFLKWMTQNISNSQYLLTLFETHIVVFSIMFYFIGKLYNHLYTDFSKTCSVWYQSKRSIIIDRSNICSFEHLDKVSFLNPLMHNVPKKKKVWFNSSVSVKSENITPRMSWDVSQVILP